MHALNKKGGIVLKRGIVTATDGLEILVDHSEGGTLVRLQGRCNIDSSPDLRKRLLDILRGQPTEIVVVDLANVTYIDSSGIATLIEGLKIARNCQRKFCLQGLHGRLLHLFEVTGVSALFEMSGCKPDASPSKVS